MDYLPKHAYILHRGKKYIYIYISILSVEWDKKNILGHFVFQLVIYVGFSISGL